MSPYPRNLEQLPILLPGEDSEMRKAINEWLDRQQPKVSVVGEFDNAALMAAFGREQCFRFQLHSQVNTRRNAPLSGLASPTPSAIKYYALTIKRRLTHPCVRAIPSQGTKALHEIP